MKGQCQSLDRISALPEEIIEQILSHMPIRDAIRTSILSKKRRYWWTSIPKLVFDDNLVKVSSDSDDEEINSNEFVKAIFHVLLLHRAPISELCVCLSAAAKIVDEIDQIMLHLSWNKNMKKLIFYILSGDKYYKLPCSFFSLHGLEHLSLGYCKIEHPLMFNGFSMLKSLILYEVDITFTMLQRFLTGCPLLEEFTLNGYCQTEFTGGNKCTFVELFKCLPSVQVVNISWSYFKHFAAGGVSQKLPTSLVYLRILVLTVCFCKEDEISSALYVINSSPNLEKIKIMIVGCAAQTFTTLLDLQDFSDLNLDHLKELEIRYFHNNATEMEFVKLIMAKSPVLKKAQIDLCTCVSVEEEVEMLRDLVLVPFPHASPAARLIIQRP